jgi:hypothetical protein
MFFAGSRASVPSSRYNRELTITEAVGWTPEQIDAADWDYVEELLVRIQKRNARERQLTEEANRV